MKRIILITGGQRSGKSTYAEKMALKLSSKPMYIATAHIWDEEFQERVLRHKERRKDAWTLVEEEKNLSKIQVSRKVVLIDCLTLWATNFISEKENFNVDETLKTLKDELSLFTSQDATFIFVTNEIGMGGVSINPLQRKFTDLLGWLNQWVASISDEVILMVSGIPVKIK
ncbi:MAG: bifunctional adenosylcobinamide kinase/adenosylcobinamide-phosphate guanylyltransferase [Prevotella sp.]|nr:bifunctional adenosylcobinamide kinase/adenosylcobinamide-phosphate guanylyltransferase [Prevotella sp.]